MTHPSKNTDLSYIPALVMLNEFKYKRRLEDGPSEKDPTAINTDEA